MKGRAVVVIAMIAVLLCFSCFGRRSYKRYREEFSERSFPLAWNDFEIHSTFWRFLTLDFIDKREGRNIDPIPQSSTTRQKVSEAGL